MTGNVTTEMIVEHTRYLIRYYYDFGIFIRENEIQLVYCSS